MMVTVYGIANCDTVKKARAWLEAHGIEYRFHDYKKSGLDRAKLDRWVGEFGWEKVLNRAGTTFRKLADHDKANLDSGKAVMLMLASPSMIKRPIVEGAGATLIGFSPDQWIGRFVRTA